MSILRIVLDPGHGGSDPGALHAGWLEKDLTLAIALKTRAAFKTPNEMVQFTRGDDRFVSLADRCTFANARGADLFLSIHLNADPDADLPGMPEARGEEIWVYPGAKRSREYAEGVAQALRTHFPEEPFRGVKEGNLYVLKHTEMPAILIEVGFIDNSESLWRLCDDATQYNLGRAIAEGIRNVQCKNSAPLSSPLV